MCWSNFTRIFFSPKKFFSKTRKEKNIDEALKTYIVASLIGVILTVIVNLAFPGTMPMLFPALGPMMAIARGAMMFFVGIIAIFLMSGLIHLFVPPLGGKKEFRKTFNALAYSAVPGAILMFLMYFNFYSLVIFGVLIFAWTITLEIMALSRHHNVSAGRAFMMILIPLSVLVAILLIILIFVSLAMLAYLGPQAFLNY